MKSSAKKVELAPYDDLFSTEESRQDAKLEKVREIPLSELHPFKNHPFKVKDDEAMMETADSVRQYGVLVPAIARPDPEGGYELVAGHRRHRASELAGKETMPVIVRDLDDDAATIIMVDSNLQRESLLPSERAFAYKMKLDAMKHQGERVDLTCSQVGNKLEGKKSSEILAEQVEIRYRTETSTDPETGETTSEEVPYEYYILNVKLTSKPISAVASELLTPEQMEMYQVYRQTMGNKPLLFGGGSPDMSNSEDLTGVQFVNGTRPGNPQLVELAKRQVGNVGGYPYWSWYGFDSRVEWCACFVSWCYNQAGKSEPRFAGCEWQGVPWFQSHGQWGARGYNNLAPGDAIFFDWDLDGTADHVGIVIGTDGSRVYTVEGNSGDACKIKSYDLNYQSIKGYGLMNW